MNEQQFTNKMEKDGIRVKKAVDNMAADGVSQLKNEYKEFSGTFKDNVNDAAKSIRKDVNDGMKQYNSKAHEIADKLHSGISQNVSKYPWVVISLGLIIGIALGFMFKPSRQSR